MIPTLTKPGLAELPPKSAYDKLAFIEAHYDEICEMYQTIMEHLKLPQVENNSGSGVEYVTHEYKANYIDIYLTTEQLSRIGYTVEEAVLKIPYRSFIMSKDWGNLPVEYNHSAKCKYQGTENISGTDYYIFRFPRFLGAPYETRELIGIFTNNQYNGAIKCVVNGSYSYSYSYKLNPFYNLDHPNCMFDNINIESIGSTYGQTDTFTEVYVKDTTGRYIC